MDEFWETRDFCLIPVINPKRETAPAALIFLSTIEKTTSYDELCEMDGHSCISVIVAPKGTILGDYMHQQMGSDGTMPDDMLHKAVTEFIKCENLPQEENAEQRRLGLDASLTHYDNMQTVKLDYLTQPHKAAQYAECLATVRDLRYKLLDLSKPAWAPKHIESMELLCRDLRRCLSMHSFGWDHSYRDTLAQCEELAESGLLSQDYYLRTADWLKEQRDTKQNMNFFGIKSTDPALPPKVYAWHPETGVLMHVSELTSPFQANDDFHNPWILNKIFFPQNKTDPVVDGTA